MHLVGLMLRRIVTNFDSVVNRFNDELSMKSYVLIDEELRLLMLMHAAAANVM